MAGVLPDEADRLWALARAELARREAVEIRSRRSLQAPGCLSFREDDQDADRVRGGPNDRLSLTEAHRNFHAVGACDERCTEFVRVPLPDEHPAV
ncbi:CPCC family cysteine-rich protein [Streptomyces sp. NPDC018036]